MLQASEELNFEKSCRIRDEIAALQDLDLRGDVEADMQPEVFPIDPKKGLVGLRKVLGLHQTPRTIEGMVRLTPGVAGVQNELTYPKK